MIIEKKKRLTQIDEEKEREKERKWKRPQNIKDQIFNIDGPIILDWTDLYISTTNHLMVPNHPANRTYSPDSIYEQIVTWVSYGSRLSV